MEAGAEQPPRSVAAQPAQRGCGGGPRAAGAAEWVVGDGAVPVR